MTDEVSDLWIGVDGEGKGRNPHKYTLLAASTEGGGWHHRIANVDRGLSTKACLEFLVNIPAKRAFSYGFNYDLTKVLADMDDMSLFYLMRPELRQSPIDGQPPLAVPWNEFRLNLQGTKFTIKRYDKSIVIWDLLRFFQCKFTKALIDWQVISEEEIEAMEAMKKQRGEFDKVSNLQIEEYCLSECRSMAALARKLTVAHSQAGLTLKNYFGAGSTGAAILDDMGIKEKIRNEIPYCTESDFPADMFTAVMSSFFGGRFENSIIGPVAKTVYSADISSAYPYQLAFMPCLEHGAWNFTDDIERVKNARAALVNWQLVKDTGKLWGPFPFRTREGTILFPTNGGKGWVYKDEFFAGQKLFPDSVKMVAAYVLEDQTCNCRPFPKMGHYYNERVRIGKSGPGIVFKLGPNSVYGKLAQSVGKPQYQCWLWAGMITSGCRAQILESMAKLKDVNNVLAIATDGIYALEEPPSLVPLDTGTWETKKPLGGWEISVVEKGMFFARPGINFPLAFDEQGEEKKKLEKVRARGVGRKSLYDNRRKITEAWAHYLNSVDFEAGEFPTVNFPKVQRFVGAKSATKRKENGSEDTGGYEYEYSRREEYGEWTDMEIVMSFNPAPKRRGIVDGNRLATLKLPQDAVSLPYLITEEIGERQEERDLMRLFKQVHGEQPGWAESIFEDMDEMITE